MSGCQVARATARPSSEEARAPAGESLRTRAWTQATRVLTVAAPVRSYLVVNENFNLGWRAVANGKPWRAVQLDGWRQAWLLPAGTYGVVTLTYSPDAPYRASLLGGYLGAVLLPASTAVFMTALALRANSAFWIWVAWPPFVAGLLLAASIVGALGDHLVQAGDVGTIVATLRDTVPQLLGIVVVGRLAAALLTPDRAASRPVAPLAGPAPALASTAEAGK